MLRHWTIIVATCIASLLLHKAYPQTTPIALPSGTVEGRLDNGFHYLILPNATPASKVEFRLIMRVGSLQETEEEKGCAHFLEHVAFGGTTNFPKRTMVKTLEKLGMKYGQDINALTGFDRTIYMFAVPVDNQKDMVISNSLLIIRDWLDGMTIDPEKVENEKGIILEELRSYELGDEFYSLKIGNGLFGRRIPLGSAEDIQNVTPNKLKQFYQKWYRPELATLVVVGDVEPQEIEQRIKERFSSLKRSPSPIKRSPQPLEYSPEISLSEVRDSLRSTSRMEFIIPHPCVVEHTLDDAVLKQKGRLLIKAINARLQAQKLSCDVSDQWYLSDKNHFVIAIEGGDKQELLHRMTKIVTELNCLARDGWDPKEWQYIKNDFYCKYESCEALPSSRLSSAWCDDFVDYVISGDKYMSHKSEQEQVKNALKKVSGKEIQELLSERLSHREKSLLVAYINHTNSDNTLVTKEIEDVWKRGLTAPCSPYNYITRQQEQENTSCCTPACLSVRPTFHPAYITETKVYEQTGIHEVTLRNGIKLVLKPTTLSDSTLLLTSFAPEGLSSIPEADYPLLEGTASYMDMGGIAKACNERLNDYLYKNDIALSTVIDNHWHGFMGMSPTSNATEFFNLIYEKIIDPKLNYEDFEESKKEQLSASGRETTLKKMLKRDTQRMLTARINELMGRALPASLSQPTAAELHRLNLDSIATFYKSLYTRPEGTTYIICGNFDPEVVTKQFASVFGRMPSSRTTTHRNYSDFRLPQEKVSEHFFGADETQTLFDFLFFGHYQPGMHNTLVLKLMCHIIRNRLISVLREQESLVYSPYVTLEYEAIPWGTFYFDINASTDHKNMKQIEALLLDILRNLQHEEVEETELESLKRSFRITKRETLNEASPSAWRTTLTTLLKNGESIADFDRYEHLLADITPAVLRQAFGELLDLDKYVLLYISKKTFDNNKLDKNDDETFICIVPMCNVPGSEPWTSR
ncbi:pitrilysin family protein [Porphyromonas sp.]|uniref:M16 family metallopeptidase n=1 Tax=Porphyromonas sp. TaxID=1924944 RepID=UPI0026DC5AC0|nr:insulinase family protein [Porphyromonas sp.]MDO4770795.1 insulinase family protein [Porphyromonas sp.]